LAKKGEARMTSIPLPIRSEAIKALRHSAHPALRRLSVEETDTTLVIKGSVSSYYLKQLAQETLKGVRGKRKVINEVQVVRS
jgi:osmotically-inducible protein OsmY